jgi:hypothetical protein
MRDLSRQRETDRARAREREERFVAKNYPVLLLLAIFVLPFCSAHEPASMSTTCCMEGRPAGSGTQHMSPTSTHLVATISCNSPSTSRESNRSLSSVPCVLSSCEQGKNERQCDILVIAIKLSYT